MAFYQALSDEGARKGLIFSAVAVVTGVVLYFVAAQLNPRILPRRNQMQPRRHGDTEARSITPDCQKTDGAGMM